MDFWQIIAAIVLIVGIGILWLGAFFSENDVKKHNHLHNEPHKKHN